MSTEAIFIGVVLAGAVLLYSLLPILQDRVRRTTQEKREVRIEVHDQRNRLYRIIDSIRDLDFDFDTNKINYEVYAEQRKLLIGRGVSALIQLDKAETHLAILDDEIEAQIAARRQSGQRDVAPSNNGKHQDAEDALEAAIAARRGEVSS